MSFLWVLGFMWVLIDDWFGYWGVELGFEEVEVVVFVGLQDMLVEYLVVVVFVVWWWWCLGGVVFCEFVVVDFQVDGVGGYVDGDVVVCLYQGQWFVDEGFGVVVQQVVVVVGVVYVCVGQVQYVGYVGFQQFGGDGEYVLFWYVSVFGVGVVQYEDVVVGYVEVGIFGGGFQVGVVVEYQGLVGVFEQMGCDGVGFDDYVVGCEVVVQYGQGVFGVDGFVQWLDDVVVEDFCIFDVFVDCFVVDGLCVQVEFVLYDFYQCWQVVGVEEVFYQVVVVVGLDVGDDVDMLVGCVEVVQCNGQVGLVVDGYEVDDGVGVVVYGYGYVDGVGEVVWGQYFGWCEVVLYYLYDVLVVVG